MYCLFPVPVASVVLNCPAVSQPGLGTRPLAVVPGTGVGEALSVSQLGLHTHLAGLAFKEEAD